VLPVTPDVVWNLPDATELLVLGADENGLRLSADEGAGEVTYWVSL
jgi:hypothetical protein